MSFKMTLKTAVELRGCREMNSNCWVDHSEGPTTKHLEPISCTWAEVGDRWAAVNEILRSIENFRKYWLYALPSNHLQRLQVRVRHRAVTVHYHQQDNTRNTVHIFQLLATATKARFPLPELTGDWFPLPVNTCWRAPSFHYISWRAVLMGNGKWSPINLGSGNRG